MRRLLTLSTAVVLCAALAAAAAQAVPRKHSAVNLTFATYVWQPTTVAATKAIVEDLTYDSRTRRFRFDLVARPATSPIVILKTSAHSKAGGPHAHQ